MKRILLVNSNTSGLCAFTLTELVVVSSMIAVLTTILVPAISKTKSEAMRILCANNEKQIGLALQFYLQENSKYLCFAKVPKFSYQPGDRTVFWDYRILAYNLTTNLFFCPGKPRRSSLTNWFAYDGLNELMPNQSYGYNGTGTSFTPSPILADADNPFLGFGGEEYTPEICESSILQPSDFISNSDYDPFLTNDDQDLDRYPCMLIVGLIGRHNGKLNCMYADNHVTSSTTNTLKEIKNDAIRFKWNRDHQSHPELEKSEFR